MYRLFRLDRRNLSHSTEWEFLFLILFCLARTMNFQPDHEREVKQIVPLSSLSARSSLVPSFHIISLFYSWLLSSIRTADWTRLVRGILRHVVWGKNVFPARAAQNLSGRGMLYKRWDDVVVEQHKCAIMRKDIKKANTSMSMLGIFVCQKHTICRKTGIFNACVTKTKNQKKRKKFFSLIRGIWFGVRVVVADANCRMRKKRRETENKDEKTTLFPCYILRPIFQFSLRQRPIHAHKTKFDEIEK